MSHLFLRTVLLDLDKSLRDTERLAGAAQQWVSVSFPQGIPRFSPHYRDTVTKLCFFQAFLSWEVFLEETFTLYLLGKRAPTGPRPHRLGVRPATRKEAVLLIVGTDRKYADWTRMKELNDRAKKLFRDGKPYTDAFLGQKQFFEEMRVIRNAIAHSSGHSQEEFKKLARSKLLGTFPPKMTVGSFLASTVPGSSPPQSFLEYYMDRVTTVAGKIVPV
jgi:hypothetical protein